MIEKEYYDLEEAAELAKCSVKDILYLAETGKARLHIRPKDWEGKYRMGGKEGHRYISNLQPMAQWMVERIRSGYLLDKPHISLYVSDVGTMEEEVTISDPEQITLDAIFIMREELLRITNTENHCFAGGDPYGWKASAQKICDELRERYPDLKKEKICGLIHEEMLKKHEDGEPNMTGRTRVPKATTIGSKEGIKW